MRPIVQISLDLTSIPEALETAKMAMRAGVDWLEAGTPLIIAEGMRGVRELRAAFPDTPIVADLKTMDGGWLEAELMAKAGTSMVVVMGQAHIETVELVVRAGKDFGVKVMGDNLGMPEAVAGARLLAEAGCDYIIHHIAFDLRTLWKERGRAVPSPLDQLHSVVEAVDKPVQAVGGLSIEQAIETPKYGAPLVVIGAPLAIDASSFRTAGGDVERALRQICEKVHAYGDIPVGQERRS
jgi:3-hexulose-6-phosphate synthase